MKTRAPITFRPQTCGACQHETHRGAEGYGTVKVTVTVEGVPRTAFVPTCSLVCARKLETALFAVLDGIAMREATEEQQELPCARRFG